MGRPQRTILCVDDDRDAADMLAESFRAAGDIASVAHSARAAWAIVAAVAVDCVVTDLAMPDASGLVLAGRIRSDRWLRALPIIAVSGVALDAVATCAVSTMFDGFHRKPLSFDDLAAEIDVIVRRHRAMR